ncbi:unnamed protein product [Schistosoma mattheei]|uniref:Coatomer subunit epsilon n=1 Tax=Schistosoma mattheei TaxID=31246 RepID=A0A3P8EP66_9TREM|nr:unnamed protein product [Schistosoma mattheei]
MQSNVLTYQVYIAQKKYGVVLDEIPEDANEPELKLLRLLATYLSKGVSEDAVVKQLDRILEQHMDLSQSAIVIAATIYLHLDGGDQLQEAIHIYEELKEKHGPSTLLLNGQAAALMGMNNWVEAEPVLQEAIDLDGNNPDTIVNMIVVYHHLGKPAETINRLISQLRDCCKDHPFLVDYVEKEDEFTRCAKHYAPSVPG